MSDVGLRPCLPVVVDGESLVSHAGGTSLIDTARRSGLARELSVRLEAWRRRSQRTTQYKITPARASARERVWSWAGTPPQNNRAALIRAAGPSHLRVVAAIVHPHADENRQSAPPGATALNIKPRHERRYLVDTQRADAISR